MGWKETWPQSRPLPDLPGDAGAEGLDPSGTHGHVPATTAAA